MICNMILRCSEGVSSIVLKEEADYRYVQATKSVYQDKKYKIYLSITDVPQNHIIDHVELYVNNKPLTMYYNEKTGKHNSSFDAVFSTLFGYIQFSVKICMVDSSEYVFYSEYFVVAIRDNTETEEIEKSLSKMIDSIYNADQSLMYQSGLQQRVFDSRSIGESNYKTLDADIALLRTVISVYTKNLFNFTQNPYGKVCKQLVVDDFDKVNVINNKVIHYIVSHQEQLSVSNSKEGFRLGRKYYYPQKALVEKNIIDTNVYENQVVVSFLKCILYDVRRKVHSVQSMINQSIKINVDINNEYILSSSIIYKLTHFRIQSYVDKLMTIQAELQSLYLQYRRIIHCDEIFLSRDRLPMPTNVIYSKPHYRNVYDTIIKWFKSGDCLYSQEKTLMNFVTAEQIYEYYCLINIINVFKEIGFAINKDNITYKAPDRRFSNIEVNNYFKLSNGRITAYLYYQPVIYSSNESERYGIELFRVDDNFYTPDFIIKFKFGTKEEYLIMDSKWASRKSIRDNYFNDVMFKYGIATRNIKDINQMNSVWILQGKNDTSKKKVDRLNRQSYASNNDTFLWQYGIVTLTPEGDFEDIKGLINVFIQRI